MSAGTENVLLHIGKTGGTSLAGLLERAAPHSGSARILLLRHRVSLAVAAKDHPAASIGFVLRDPIERAVSGFISRLRCGRPRYDNPWRADEKIAFTRFPTPNALGEALAVGDPQAQKTLGMIQHLKFDYPHYLGDIATVKAHRDRIFWIGHITSLDRDVAQMLHHVGLPHNFTLGDDPIAKHENPFPDLAILDQKARTGFARALEKDYAIYDYCMSLRSNGPLLK